MAGRHLQIVTDNTVHQVSAQRVNIKRIIVTNQDAAIIFIQFFNLAAADVTLGTTVAPGWFAVAASVTQEYPLDDMLFDTAFSYALTTTVTGNTGVTADGFVAISYF